MNRRLILIRHAHRDIIDRDADNGLSIKGRKQSKWIAKYAQSFWKPEEFNKGGGQILCSPKIRCIETVEPLAAILKAEVTIEKLLEEKASKETEKEFQNRVCSFLAAWRKMKSRELIVCSHGDYLPLLLFQCLGIAFDVRKGSWVELEWSSAGFELKAYIPNFKLFFKI